MCRNIAAVSGFYAYGLTARHPLGKAKHVGRAQPKRTLFQGKMRMSAVGTAKEQSGCTKGQATGLTVSY